MFLKNCVLVVSCFYRHVLFKLKIVMLWTCQEVSPFGISIHPFGSTKMSSYGKMVEKGEFYWGGSEDISQMS